MSGDVLVVVSLDLPEARDLEERMIGEMRSRYGGRGPAQVLRAEEFSPPVGCFAIARNDHGSAVACGGFRRLDPETAEIKRMYVDPGARGAGLGRRLLLFLEEQAATAGYREIWLETGSLQPEAVALYESAGYRPIRPYGEFRADPRSRCYMRRLARSGRVPTPGRRPT